MIERDVAAVGDNAIDERELLRLEGERMIALVDLALSRPRECFAIKRSMTLSS